MLLQKMAQLMGHCRNRAGKLSSIMDYSPAVCKAQLNVIAHPCEQEEQIAQNRYSFAEQQTKLTIRMFNRLQLGRDFHWDSKRDAQPQEILLDKCRNLLKSLEIVEYQQQKALTEK